MMTRMILLSTWIPNRVKLECERQFIAPPSLCQLQPLLLQVTVAGGDIATATTASNHDTYVCV